MEQRRSEQGADTQGRRPCTSLCVTLCLFGWGVCIVKRALSVMGRLLPLRCSSAAADSPESTAPGDSPDAPRVPPQVALKEQRQVREEEDLGAGREEVVGPALGCVIRFSNLSCGTDAPV